MRAAEQRNLNHVGSKRRLPRRDSAAAGRTDRAGSCAVGGTGGHNGVNSAMKVKHQAVA